MRNFRLTVEYDGTEYNGWQIQNRNQRRKGGKVKTIQGVLSDALSKIFSKKIRLISSGRTDSGVHAKSHVANLKVSTRLQPSQVKKAINSLLPRDIVVKKVEEVPLSFNAQYDALSKTYRYAICNGGYVSPFIRRYVYRFKQPLDVSVMRKEAKILLGTHDLKAFKSSGGKTIDNIRTIKKLTIKKSGALIEIDIEADSFLYNMARNIVGTLIEVGRNKFSTGSTRKILEKKDRRLAGPTVPARGLCLIDVTYRDSSCNSLRIKKQSQLC
jgi:tRNA pseudouridine38-40 synthase